MACANPSRSILTALAGFCLLLAAACRQGETPQRPPEPTESREPRWSVAGRIALPKGVEATGILVFAEGTSLLATTDQDGQWILRDVPVGDYRFRARREDLRPALLGALTLSTRQEGAPPPGTRVDLPMIDMALLPVVGTDRPQPQAGALRGVIRLLHGSDDYAGIMVQVAGTDVRTVTNPVGEYYFPALAPGDVRLTFNRKDLMPAEAPATVVQGREMPGPIVEMRPEETAQTARRVIRGQIEMADAQGNTVALFNRVIVSLEGTTHVAVPDSQGRFLFDDLPPGAYTVMATAPAFELRDKIEVNLANLEATEVTVHLDRSEEAEKNLGSVAGRVLFETPPDTGDNSGILVSLVGTNMVAVTDLDGNYQIANAPPGGYLFRAQAEGHIPEFVDGVNVRAGEETRLPELTLLRYIVPPEVVYTEPANGARGVAIVRDTPLYIRFSKRMRPETVKSAFSIAPPVGARLFMGKEHPQSDFDLLYVELLGTPGYPDATPLAFSATYRVTIDDVATDYEDARLEEPYTFEFTMGEPMIISARPADGERFAFVSHREPLVIEFNAQMDHDKFSAQDVQFRPEANGRPTIQAVDDPVSGWTVLRAYTQLDLDKEYTVTLRGNWRTVNGAKISNMPYRVRFKTAQFYEYKPYLGRKD